MNTGMDVVADDARDAREFRPVSLDALNDALSEGTASVPEASGSAYRPPAPPQPIYQPRESALQRARRLRAELTALEARRETVKKALADAVADAAEEMAEMSKQLKEMRSWTK